MAGNKFLPKRWQEFWQVSSTYWRSTHTIPKKSIDAPCRPSLSYGIATKMNNTSQLTPCGALSIAIVGRIMPATASKTAPSLLLLSEFRGPFYSALTTLQVRSADDDD